MAPSTGCCPKRDCPRWSERIGPHSSIPYLPFVVQTLKQYPRLTASRLYAMVRERGYTGGPDHFRHLMAHYRPRPEPEAYLRLKTLPGEQAQVDWGHFGKLTHRARRAHPDGLRDGAELLAGRSSCASSSMRGWPASCAGTWRPSQTWGGLPRVLLYDNLKSAVLERQGDAIRFHPTLLALAAHYRFEPRPVAVARGNEKGRVERAIRYIRDSLLRRADLDRSGRPQCPGRRLVPGSGR